MKARAFLIAAAAVLLAFGVWRTIRQAPEPPPAIAGGGDRLKIGSGIRLQSSNDAEPAYSLSIGQMEVARQPTGILRFKFEKKLTLSDVELRLSEAAKTNPATQPGGASTQTLLPQVPLLGSIADYPLWPSNFEVYGVSINGIRVGLKLQSGKEILIQAGTATLKQGDNRLVLTQNVSMQPLPDYVQKIQSIQFPIKPQENPVVTIEFNAKKSPAIMTSMDSDLYLYKFFDPTKSSRNLGF